VAAESYRTEFDIRSSTRAWTALERRYLGKQPGLKIPPNGSIF